MHFAHGLLGTLLETVSCNRLLAGELLALHEAGGLRGRLSGKGRLRVLLPGLDRRLVFPGVLWLLAALPTLSPGLRGKLLVALPSLAPDGAGIALHGLRIHIAGIALRDISRIAVLDILLALLGLLALLLGRHRMVARVSAVGEVGLIGLVLFFVGACGDPAEERTETVGNRHK